MKRELREQGPKLVKIRGVLVDLRSGAVTLAKGGKAKKPKPETGTRSSIPDDGIP